MAAGLAVAAAALASAFPDGRTLAPVRPSGGADGAGPRRAAAAPARRGAGRNGGGDPASGLVRAPVRIADAGVVRLLHPGDRVDILAASRVVATGARVAGVPAQDDAEMEGGGLVVLSVPRATAAALAGAAARSPLTLALV